MVPYATLACEATERSWLKCQVPRSVKVRPQQKGSPYIRALNNADSSNNQNAVWMTGGHGTRIRGTELTAAACAHRKGGFAPPFPELGRMLIASQGGRSGA
ncbi:hypothetical protein CH63R_13601 [Colletotrichum higginsianum IMI 349063]|uniref:Uncharacterized protein n=1 Tax=Colletotrichum higginsianum (strain IMI 349063) TaxID=759273 RepID=A0A1B7XRI4_COLHI|nr:hypothetical protein CH63R_13601 [Colletotrichum higginsianum IMI 349063]OBR02375.1 hypothetical protein CH63R_13601 [Colletotrichum higginsianum IMI 349063]